MNRNETVDLLSVIAAYDKRTVGDADVLAWHAACKDLDLAAATRTVVAWFKNPANQGGWFTPGALRGAIRLNGAGDPAEAAEQRRANDAACPYCDDHGFINGTQTCNCKPGGPWCSQPYDSTIRCDHTDATLPPGFVPDVVRRVPSGS